MLLDNVFKIKEFLNIKVIVLNLENCGFITN